MDKEIGIFCCCCWFEGFLIIKQKVRNLSGNLVFEKQILKDWEPSVERRNLLKLKGNLFLICRIVCFRRKKQAVYEETEPSAKVSLFSVSILSEIFESYFISCAYFDTLLWSCTMFISRNDSFSARKAEKFKSDVIKGNAGACR